MFSSSLVRDLVQLALREDLAQGDITSQLTIPAGHHSKAEIVARQALVVCGLPIIEVVVREMQSLIAVRLECEEGLSAKDKTLLATLEGPTAELLGAERIILNFLQRLSGVATHVRSLAKAARPLTLLDTRKTTPGWRTLEKYAVRVGGARNHRFNLGDMVLVKNNHVDAHGGDLRRTLPDIHAHKPFYMPVEVEVRDLKELAIALEFEPAVIMLDNMDDPQIRQALKLIEKAHKRPLVEVSGGVTEQRFGRLKQLGVDGVSMGALTAQATNVDISMRVRARPVRRSSKRG